MNLRIRSDQREMRISKIESIINNKNAEKLSPLRGDASLLALLAPVNTNMSPLPGLVIWNMWNTHSACSL